MITTDDIYQLKVSLQATIAEQEKELQQLIQTQATQTKPDELAASILRYNEIQQGIDDRSQVFSLLSGPLDQLRNPFIKADLFRYLEAAETVGPQLVNALVDIYIDQVRRAATAGEFDSVDDVLTEYKEIILPAKIIAEDFGSVEGLVLEMHQMCVGLDPDYNTEHDHTVLMYGFRKAIDADTRMEPTIQALRQAPLPLLNDDDRKQLLDQAEEHLAVLRFDKAKNQTLAMEQAITRLSLAQ